MIVPLIPELIQEKVHYRPRMSLSDGTRLLKPQTVKARMKDLRKVAKAVGGEV